jgi:dihydrofolate reductase
MKVTLYNAITLDGFIAKEDGNSEWVSGKDAEMFEAACRKAGCIFVGRRTFEMYPDLYPMNGVTTIVLSKGEKKSEAPSVLYASDAEEAIKVANERGHNEAVLVGGSLANSAFLKAGMIDEIIFDLHPLYLGRGIGVFEPGLAPSLELLSATTPGDELVQLHYKVRDVTPH